MKLKLARKFYRAALVWWKYWSYLFRWLFHRRYEDIRLGRQLTVGEVLESFMLLTWTKDSFRELGDACGSPHWTQYAINCVRAGRTQPRGGLDCDDYSIWAAHVIDQSYKPQLFLAAWMKDGQLKGHVMCLCRVDETTFFHIGNWGKTRNYTYIEDAANDIMRWTGASDFVGWAILDKELNYQIGGTGLPVGM